MQNKSAIEDMTALAAQRGGRCRSTEYENSRMPIEWECVEGHRWMANPVTIRQGSWCPICALALPKAGNTEPNPARIVVP